MAVGVSLSMFGSPGVGLALPSLLQAPCHSGFILKLMIYSTYFAGRGVV
jgi:hypothetical protein